MVQLIDAQRCDMPDMLLLLSKLAQSEGLDKLGTTLNDIEQSLLGSHALATFKYIYVNGKKAGFLVYSWKWAPFSGKRDLYMQALYILPEFRRLGIAKQAMQWLAQFALTEGALRLEWHVVKDKLMSNTFYDAIGAERVEHMAMRRLSGQALIALAHPTLNDDKAALES